MKSDIGCCKRLADENHLYIYIQEHHLGGQPCNFLQEMHKATSNGEKLVTFVQFETKHFQVCLLRL